MTTSFKTGIWRSGSASRLLSGAAMLLFLAGVVAAPLCSALSLCAMPCCHQASPTVPAATNDLPCHTDCTISDPQNIPLIAPSSLLRTTVTVPAALTVTMALAAPALSSVSDIGAHSTAPNRALHLVNSVFLI
jgi:hypothetical protein